MGRSVASAKHNIVSVRVTDDEMENIKKLMEKTNKRASDVMREAFELLASRINNAESQVGTV